VSASSTDRAALALALALCACAPTAIQGPPPTNASDDDRSVGRGDIFDVRVYGEEDLSTDYQVADDGTIDFPYVGRLEVAGMEAPAIAEALATRLRDGGVLIDPQVSVVVREVNSRRITITGAVRSPGNYPLSPGLTAVQAVNLAGGFTDLANRDGTILRRRVDGELRRYSVPIDRVTRGDAEDVLVRSGDVLFVPERVF
jgi:protein involved in polysaccharide export with SLBB domain